MQPKKGHVMLTPAQLEERRQAMNAPPPSASVPRSSRPRTQPAPRPSVRPLAQPASPSLERRQSLQDRELRKQNRLLPSRDALLQRVLAWSLDQLRAGAPDDSLKLRDIPDSFANTDEYVAVFEPLLLAEIRATLERDLEQCGGDDQGLEVQMGVVVRKDPFRALSLRVARGEEGQVPYADNSMRQRWAVDDVLELSAGSQSMLALVTKIEWLPKERVEEASVSVCPRNVAAVQWVPLWNARRVSTLVTSVREYRSMMSMQHLPLRDAVLSGRVSATAAAAPVLPVPPLLARRFNESQQQAIVTTLLQPHGFTLIQGPPGTGKTLTVVGLIGSLLMAEANQRPGAERTARKRILLCAASNKAVDEVASRLLNGVWDPFSDRVREIALVRVGRVEAMSEGVKSVSLERLAAKRCAGRTQRSVEQVDHSETAIAEISRHLDELAKQITELDAVQTALVALRNSSEELFAKGVTPAETEVATKLRNAYQTRSGLRSRLKRTRDSRAKATQAQQFDLKTARDEVLRLADVVCSTLSSAGSDALVQLDLEFDAVIVDEATQATELQALIPLKYRSRMCVLVGDPKQLPATVMSKAAVECSFHQSLFQRLERLGAPVSLLNTQYRMHPLISAFPNAWFYDGKLVDGPRVRVAKPFHQHDLFVPFLFIDVAGQESRQQGQTSAFNRDEAQLASDLTRALLAAFEADVGGGVAVITPYRRQMEALRSMLLPHLSPVLQQLVDVNTIDGFQGCEKDVVIFSCVRSHSGQSIGFLDDVRRLNVALTRARHSLVVLGNAELLAKHTAFAALIDHARRCDSFMTERDARMLLEAGPRKRLKPEPSQAPPGPSGATPRSSRLKTGPSVRNERSIFERNSPLFS